MNTLVLQNLSYHKVKQMGVLKLSPYSPIQFHSLSCIGMTVTAVTVSPDVCIWEMKTEDVLYSKCGVKWNSQYLV